MDAPKQLPDQDMADHQPSEIPIQSDETYPQAISDSKTPVQQEACPKKPLAIEQFQSTLETLADLDRDDPKLAFQAARTVGLYRRLWGSCVPKHREGEKPDENDKTSRETITKVSNERDGLQHRPDEQLSRLYSFEQALGQTQERLIGVLKDWNQCSRSDLAALMDIKRCA
ncbi:unnamed protein product [Penicillium salamii]|uniref:Uncharacterized protein n=1 Tax=Penicillium salamii TaxID=1612424 RepID=A0A9W4JD65_9EURO|nr:unnamed protein product [Penicillium salamii]CAG8082623.1 unnamed protein product [Penicillium salamii]CAG8146882.1 unnamed protein product [Penicillium salamii]CAG8367616.1 unnamed protein product [Penicillium salamii]CAG8385057.1 unnamed protein product [Penicillium salamii]